VSGIHALNAKDADIPLFQAFDEVSDSRLAKVNSGQIEHHRFASKNPGERARVASISSSQAAIGTTGQKASATRERPRIRND